MIGSKRVTKPAALVYMPPALTSHPKTTLSMAAHCGLALQVFVSSIYEVVCRSAWDIRKSKNEAGLWDRYEVETYILRAKVVKNGVVGFGSNPSSGHQLCYNIRYDPKQAMLVKLASNIRPFPVEILQTTGCLKCTGGIDSGDML